MKAGIFSGIAVLAAAALYGGVKLAKSVDVRIEQHAPAPDYDAVKHHIDDAIYALTPIESNKTMPFFGFEVDAGRSARPAAARSELEQALAALPASPMKESINKVYLRLPDTVISGSTFDQERKELRSLADMLKRP